MSQMEASEPKWVTPYYIYSELIDLGSDMNLYDH